MLALAFPLHPPGAPEKSRLPELDLPAAAGLPTLVLQGIRDPFGGPPTSPRRPGRVVVPVEGGDHSFRVPRWRPRRGPDPDRRAVTAWALAVCTT